MGNHHADDEGGVEQPADQQDGVPEPIGGSLDDHRDPVDPLGLFGDPDGVADDAEYDADPGTDVDGPGTGAEFDSGTSEFGELRDVLAGRAAPRYQREDPDGGDTDADDTDGYDDAPRPESRRPRPVRVTLIAALVMVIILAGVAAGVWWWWGQRPTDVTDWAGTGSAHTGSAHTGSTHTVVRVQNGDGLYAVGLTLVADGVVANAQTFAQVALDDGRLSALSPGYYRVRTHSSSQTAVDDLADPDNRLGQLRIIPGQTLADITTVATDGTTSVKEGILSAIVDACVPTDGDDACFSVDDLWQVEQDAPLNELGVVGWAVDEVRHAPDPKRRLEGLVLPGDYTIAPGSTAQEALAAVVSASSADWNRTDVVAAAEAQGRSEYDIVTIASLVQLEVIGPDMPKAARVIDNRLAQGMKLEFDSTVNYGLDRAQIATSNDERLDESNLYSTYAHHGLTPTPIGAPGPDALEAAAHPANGDWLYFVAIDTDGHTCFSDTYAQHQECVDEARANGVFG